MSVCAVLPCDNRHAVHAHEAVNSLVEQTWPISTIVIRFSSMAECPAKRARLPTLPNLFVNCTTKQESLGVVRDEGVKLCRGEEYITFLDSDDVALPYALQRMISLMRRTNASVGLHNYFPKNRPLVVRNHTELVRHYHTGKLPPFDIDAHMAHSTIRSSVWIPHRNLTIGEDSWFMNDLWDRNATFVHTQEKLTLYIDRHRKYKPLPNVKFMRMHKNERPRLVEKRRGLWKKLGDRFRSVFG